MRNDLLKPLAHCDVSNDNLKQLRDCLASIQNKNEINELYNTLFRRLLYAFIDKYNSRYKHTVFPLSLCKMVSLRKGTVENFVLSEIEKIVHNEKYVSNILDSFVEFYKERNSNSEIIKGLETKLRDVERKITNLVGVIADSGKHTDIFQSELNTLNDEKNRIARRHKKEKAISALPNA